MNNKALEKDVMLVRAADILISDRDPSPEHRLKNQLCGHPGSFQPRTPATLDEQSNPHKLEHLMQPSFLYEWR